MQPAIIFFKEGKLTRLNGHENVCFGLQYIASVTTTPRVSLVDVTGPSAECSLAVASIPVESSTFSEHNPAGGCLSSQGIDYNEVTFDLPLEELQMQEKETSIPKHTAILAVKLTLELYNL